MTMQIDHQFSNVAELIRYWSLKNPQKKAVIFYPHGPKEGELIGKSIAITPDVSSITFLELEKRSNLIGSALRARGIGKGSKVLLFLKPALDFAPVVFAIFKIGAIPVLIDPGMGRKNLLAAISKVGPEVMITEFKGILLRVLFKSAFATTKHFFTTPGNNRSQLFKILFKLILGSLQIGRWLHFNKWSVESISDLFKIEDINKRANRKNSENIESVESIDNRGRVEQAFKRPLEICRMGEQEVGAILYTSGGTGIPKGVVYTHNIFLSQIKYLQTMYNLNESDLDLPGFPFFCLFTLTMGMTVVLANMDPTRPAAANPLALINAILEQKITFAAGSPAIWERVADYALKHDIKLPSLKSLSMFGAPVKSSLHEKFQRILPNGNTYTPYGATEVLPITNVKGCEVLKEKATLHNSGVRIKGINGILVGRPLPDMEVRIIEILNHPIKDWSLVKILPAGTPGEIVVSGEVVTAKYYEMPVQTEMSKIYEKPRKVWHRMGDIGYLDPNGQLWFCGRKDHIVRTHNASNDQGILFTIPCELVFNQHPEVKRSALVGVNGIPAIVIERNDGRTNLNKEESIRFNKELLELGSLNECTSDIKKIFYYKNFPVDIRHNIKIDRGYLSKWAQAHWHTGI